MIQVTDRSTYAYIGTKCETDTVVTAGSCVEVASRLRCQEAMTGEPRNTD